MALNFLSFCQTPKPRQCLEGNCQNGFGQKNIEGDKRADGTRTYSLYKGDFLNGLMHGKGSLDLRTIQGDFYEGEFANDRYHGYGTLERAATWPWPRAEEASCPLKYEGYFSEGVPHGKGTLITRTGIKYSGDFFKGGLCYEGDCITGKGAVIYWHGLHYRGEFKQGAPHGQGEEYDAHNRTRYKGEFKNGEHDGFGIKIRYGFPKYVDGSWQNPNIETKYEGLFFKGKSNGKGEMTYYKMGVPDKMQKGIWRNSVCFDATGERCKFESLR